MLWRTKELRHIYDLCKPFSLPEGLLISHDFDQPVRYIKKAVYHQNCYHGHTPVLDTNLNLVLNSPVEPLPIVEQLWQQFTRSSDGGVFVYSVVPIVYSIAISAVITWFLTIFVITNYTIKPSLLLKSSTVLLSAYMLILVVKSIVVLHNQQKNGFLHGEALLHAVNTTTYLSIIDLVVVLLLQILQVQVVMRLFLRQSDKRLTFFVGCGAAIVSQTLWGVTRFHSFSNDAEAGKIIPALTYLVRIAMGMFYAAIFTAFLLIKLKHIAANRHIWLISLLTFVFIYAPVAFFIADISNAWVYALSEIFSVVTYVICVVIPWEWCNKYNVIQRIMEKEGVLGRRFYEDELYELDRFELFVEDDVSSRRGGGGGGGDLESRARGSASDNLSKLSLPSTSVSLRGRGSSLPSTRTAVPTKPDKSATVATGTAIPDTASTVQPSRFHAFTESSRFTMERMANGLTLFRDRFFDITDRIIATGLAIPRSVSVGSGAPVVDNHHNHQHQDRAMSDLTLHPRYQPRTEDRRRDHLALSHSRSGNRSVSFAESEPGRNRRDVFLYSRRNVVLDEDSLEDNSEEAQS